jgi:hypothetical protein
MRLRTLYLQGKTPYTAHKVGDVTVFAALSNQHAGNPAPSAAATPTAFRKLI